MLGVVTLTFAAGVEAIWFNNNSIDGGASGLGIPTPRLFGMDLGIGSGKDFPRPAFGILCLVVLVLVALGVSWLRTSRWARRCWPCARTSVPPRGRDQRRAVKRSGSPSPPSSPAWAVAAGVPAGKRDLPGLRRVLRTGNVLRVVVAGITSVSGGILAGMISAGGILVVAISSGVGTGGVDNWYGVVAGIGVILTVIFNPDGDRRSDYLSSNSVACAGSWPGLGRWFRVAEDGGDASGCSVRGWHRCPEAGELVGTGAGVGSKGHTPGVGDGRDGTTARGAPIRVRYGASSPSTASASGAIRARSSD